MTSIPIKAVVVLVGMVAVLGLLTALLLSAAAAPFDATKTFAQGCITYCAQIENEAKATNELLEIVAVRKAQSLAGTQFIEACNKFHPETRGHEYLCWNRECCDFQLPPP